MNFNFQRIKWTLIEKRAKNKNKLLVFSHCWREIIRWKNSITGYFLQIKYFTFMDSLTPMWKKANHYMCKLFHKNTCIQTRYYSEYLMKIIDICSKTFITWQLHQTDTTLNKESTSRKIKIYEWVPFVPKLFHQTSKAKYFDKIWWYSFCIDKTQIIKTNQNWSPEQNCYRHNYL